MKMFHSVVLALFVIAGCGKSEQAKNGAIKVGAASDLAFAFEEVGAAFTKKTGKHVTFTFGSTGQLAKQISEGAPYDVFAAANVAFVDEVLAAKACDPATKAMYARGRIVVWTKGPAVTKLDELADGRFVKLALANPEHAPYGKAAKEALESVGLWDKLKPKIVYGENIRQTLQFAETGNVEAAIAALSLAKVTKGGNYYVIEEALHKPIDQALVVCKRGVDPAAGREFATFVNSTEGRAIMRRYGFLLPGEPAVAEQKP
jgi:molybdate transport system substrate-binding protein